ncbi:uncharacterized protein [Euwallacea similis]|uniref:uncharacterized protein n=1 Tax=Euwallacea similis TaxID=1736056 RepID=UPI00344CC946
MDFPALAIIVIFLLHGIHSLKNVRAVVPLAAKVHDSILLQCDFDLEGEPLYTVKWYKGGREFFRFVPREDPKMQIFSVNGIQVDLSRSSANEVVLLDVHSSATGRYKCEVSTDAPNFYTKFSTSLIYVVDVPEEDPIMEVDKVSTGLSNIIKANCTTPPSFPAMNVTWYINGIKVKESESKFVSLDPVYSFSTNGKAPHMTISHIVKEIDDNMFQAGVIKVQCISSLFNLYKSENVRYIEDYRPQPWPSSVIGPTNGVQGISVFWVIWVQSMSLYGFWVVR